MKEIELNENLKITEAGYNWKKGMSNNAVNAYEQGEKPLSKWTKADLLNEFEKGLPTLSDYLKDLYKDILSINLVEKLKKLSLKELKNLLLTKSSYHHTSKYYNATDFYKVDVELALDNIYQDLDWSSFNEAVAEITEETLPELNDNFWRWFGDSVVKDDEGNPLICFHGSTLDIDEFDTEYSGMNTGNNEEKVFYFTTDREMAVSYSTEAVIRQKEIPYYDKEEGTEYETWEEFEEYLRKEVCKTPHINPCFICMEKPYIYDAGFRDFDPKLNYTLMSMIKGEIDTSHWLFDENLYYDIANEHEEYDEETDEYIQIKDFDYDGIIIRNVRDSISPLVDKYCDEYIVWSPTQIKSIYNNGNWSWNSSNVFETLNKEIERYL